MKYFETCEFETKLISHTIIINSFDGVFDLTINY